MKRNEFEPEMHPDIYEPQVYFDSSDDKTVAPLIDYSQFKTREGGEGSKTSDLVVDGQRELSYRYDVAGFVLADNETKIAEWVSRFSLESESIFGIDFAEYTEKESYELDQPCSLMSLRDHMVRAMLLKRLIDSSEQITLDDMENIGIRTREEERLSEGSNYCSARLILDVKGKAFGKYMEEGVSKFQRHAHELSSVNLEEPGGVRVLSIFEEWGFVDTDEGRKGCCSHMLDALSEVHLHAISTTTNKGIPKQRPDCIAADLWYRMCEHFRYGNVVVCAYDGCRKPFIAFENQGLRKKYCGDRCRDRARRQRQREQRIADETTSSTPQLPRERRDENLHEDSQERKE